MILGRATLVQLTAAALWLSACASAPAPPREAPRETPRASSFQDPVQLELNSYEWRALAQATPLLWAYRLGGAEVDVGEEPARASVLFLGSDQALRELDARTGATRWRLPPSPGVRWRAFAATDTRVLLLGDFGARSMYSFHRRADGAWLAGGAIVDSPYAATRPALARDGRSLYLDHGCAISLLDDDGRVLARRDGLEARIPELSVETDVHRCVGVPEVLTRGDGWTAVLAPTPSGAARLEHIDDAGARTLELELGVVSSARYDATTRLLIVERDDVIEARSTDGVKARWSVPLEGGRAQVGDLLVSAPRESSRALWIDARTGVVTGRRALPDAASWLYRGGLLVQGSFGLGRLDDEERVRWFMPNGSRVEGRFGDWLAVHTHWGVALIDPERGQQLLGAHAKRLHGVTFDADADADARVAVLSSAFPHALFGLRFTPTGGEALGRDPVRSPASDCGESQEAARASIERELACHPHALDPVVFAPGSAALDEASARALRELGARWRATALTDGPAKLLIIGDGRVPSSVDPWGVARTRAGVVRATLIDAGVDCAHLHAIDGPLRLPEDVPRRETTRQGGRVTILSVCSVCCLL